MRVIKLWYYRVTRCEYTSDRFTGEPRLNLWWGGDDEAYTYSDSMGSDGDRIDLLRAPESASICDDDIFDPHGYIPRWKAAGWDGTVEEVTEV